MTAFWHSLETVLVIFLIAGAGFWMARRNILDGEWRRRFSVLLVDVFLPCLAFAQLLPAASSDCWSSWWLLPAVAFVNICTGLVWGFLAVRLGGRREDTGAGMAAMAFVNSGYLPMGLLTALALNGTFHSPEGNIGGAGVAMVSLYLVVFTPMLWLVGYNLIACGSAREINWKGCLTPPGLTALATLVVALTPLHRLFLGQGAPLNFVYCAARLFSDATTPCAILLLGASLAGVGSRGRLGWRYLTVFCGFKYLLAPLTGLAVLWLCHRLGLALTPLLALVILLEGAMPPGLNLIIICQNSGRKLPFMSALLFWNYLLALPLMLGWLYVGQLLVRAWFPN